MKEIPRNCYRLSIISSCNMKCSYCHNEGNTKVDKLSKNDIEKLIIDSERTRVKRNKVNRGRTVNTS